MVTIRAEQFGRRYYIIAEKNRVERTVSCPSGRRPVVGSEMLCWTGSSWVGSREIFKAEAFDDPQVAEVVIDEGALQDTLPPDWQRTGMVVEARCY
jgi:hypothetical protein